jgi:hypothetical protein
MSHGNKGHLSVSHNTPFTSRDINFVNIKQFSNE